MQATKQTAKHKRKQTNNQSILADIHTNIRAANELTSMLANKQANIQTHRRLTKDYQTALGNTITTIINVQKAHNPIT